MVDSPAAERGRQPLQLVSVEERDRSWMNFPIPLTSLVGREREVRAVADLLRGPGVHLVTLTGPGGVGKTRLTLRLAEELATEFPAGIAFVALAAISDPEVVPAAIAQVLGVRDTGRRALVETLALSLRGRPFLLLLDNFEQVVEAAPFVTALLVACPALKVVVTSRVALRVQGEHEYPVPPLAVPNPDQRLPLGDLARTAAVELYVRRVKAVHPEFILTDANAQTVVEICRQLDGLPLAIELAAARGKVLSPAALASRLTHRLQVLTSGPRDQPVRLQTMRAAIAWSYDLLTPEEQRLFRRLTVFTGGFSLDAAEQVMGDGAWGNESHLPSSTPQRFLPGVLDGLASLVDKSLVLRTEDATGEVRFSMLETIREYGRERLAAEGEEAEAHHRHAAWCLALVETLAPALEHRQNAGPPFNQLAVEHDNLRAALTWLESTDANEKLLRLAGMLFLFWYVHGDLREGLTWCERALHRGAAAPPASRARALLGGGMLAHYAGDDLRAVPWLEASLALYGQIANHWGAGFALLMLGIVAEDTGDYEVATARFGESLSHARRANDPIGIGLVLFHLGIAAWGREEPERAREWLNEALEVQRTAGDLAYGAAESLAFLGQLAVEQGDLTRAIALHQESLTLHRALGSPEVIAVNLANVAVLAVAARRPETAARFFAAAMKVRAAIGNPFKLPERALYDRTIATVRATMTAADFTAAWDAGDALSLADATASAHTLLQELGSQPRKSASPRMAVDAAANQAGLTDRELEVLRLLVAGRSDREIAEILFISPRTAQGHVAHIFTKLSVNTRLAAVAAARKTGILGEGSDPD